MPGRAWRRGPAVCVRGRLGCAADFYSGAGGGAGAAGDYPGGGIGIQSSISGIATYYAGGGGSGYGETVAGQGGGGTGGGSATNGTNGLGGGGGGVNGGAGSTGKNGGSGVAIIRYSDSYAAASATTGSPTITTTGGYRIYTWTSSGSITF